MFPAHGAVAAGAPAGGGHDAHGNGAAGTVASVPFMITAAQKAALRARGVHPGVISELRPVDVQQMLSGYEPIPVNAERSPEQDLQQLVATLARARRSSADLASQAQKFAAPGIEITPAVVDAIKAGGEAMFAIRDALWIALS